MSQTQDILEFGNHSDACRHCGHHKRRRTALVGLEGTLFFIDYYWRH